MPLLNLENIAINAELTVNRRWTGAEVTMNWRRTNTEVTRNQCETKFVKKQASKDYSKETCF